MAIIVFFVVVIVFSLVITIIDKTRSYNKTSDRSIWEDGDSVVIKRKDAKYVGGGFATRLTINEDKKK